jgi:hypothetical protein
VSAIPPPEDFNEHHFCLSTYVISRKQKLNLYL